MNEKRSVLVTGSTSGVGLGMAYQLAEAGLRVILHGRDKDKGMKRVEEIKNKTGNSNIELIIADVSTVDGTVSLVEEVKNKYPQLNILISNVGLFEPELVITKDNIEKTWATNYFSHFVLIRKLMKQLIDTSTKENPSRIIITSSSLEGRSKLNLTDINFEKRKYGSFKAYQDSKLCQLLFTYYFARQIDNSQVTINAFHPGYIKTQLQRKKPFYTFLSKLLLVKGIRNGAKTGVFLALSKQVKGISGKYFKSCKEIKSSKKSYDKYLQENLWVLSDNILASWTKKHQKKN